jgi:hypothetical protein
MLRALRLLFLSNLIWGRKVSLLSNGRPTTYPSNPAHDCVFIPLCENVYDKQPNTIQPFGLWVNTH